MKSLNLFQTKNVISSNHIILDIVIQNNESINVEINEFLIFNVDNYQFFLDISCLIILNNVATLKILNMILLLIISLKLFIDRLLILQLEQIGTSYLSIILL